MLTILIIFFLLWFIRTVKNVLFWAYLWQLKEYHLRRFIDHFRTAKGRSLILDKMLALKIILLFLFFTSPVILFAALPIVYLIESIKAGYDVFRKRLIKPVFTGKVIVVVLLSLIIEILLIVEAFLAIDKIIWLSVLYLPLLLLMADMITPLFVSCVIFIFKPLSWAFRRSVLIKARQKREKYKELTVIGITGSYGKTSVKEFLAAILSAKYNVLKTKKNINAEIGIAKTVLNELKPEHQVLIAEIGAYETGKIKEVCEIIKPKIGILTGINNQHVATFGSQENIVKAKFELIDSLLENGTAIVNGNNSYIRERIKRYNGKRILAVENSIAKEVFTDKEHLSFKIDEIVFNVNVLGRHNLEDFLIAITAARKLGMPLQEISTACSKIKNNKIVKRDPVVIDASYSANPTGVMADLEYLRLYKGKRAIIMPCLIELGKDSKSAHEKIGKEINRVCDTAIITSWECFKTIKKECPKAVYSENPKDIKDKLKDFKDREDVILLEGRISKNIKDIFA